MSNIDLDLVELRCKLRGWHCARRLTITGRDELCVTAPAGSAYVIDANGCHRRSDTGVAIDEMLYRPRLTLADIIADPGEGWTCKVAYEGSTHFLWGKEDGVFHWQGSYPGGKLWDANVTIGHHGPDGEVIDFIPTRVQGERRIAAHRAVTDLLVKLAEVEL